MVQGPLQSKKAWADKVPAGALGAIAGKFLPSTWTPSNWTPGNWSVGRLPSASLSNHGEPVLGRMGSLEVRLATTKKELKQAQRLRYRVFYDEMSAVPNAASMIARRDVDDYDAICDHLLVLDHDAPRRPFRTAAPQVVGTYRLLRQEVADRHFGFYTAGEFEITKLTDSNPHLRFLELGRSCVLKPYRNKRTVELLWYGIWNYIRNHRVDVMFGCASLEGTDPKRLAMPLSFLHHHALSPEPWRVRALSERFVTMDRMPAASLDTKAALHSLPPLVKGYLRLGATFGEGAVIDRQFGTTDVLVMLPVPTINPRYIEHFGATANRQSA
ncbi:l-ornithine N(alpha)-acyltransferase [Chelatococcus asaccharovorans]|uniref:GNAT family N-acetyltransferase n=1 Tax=Chelatococcus asaccharovorans TaxID=28210 RepID=UPI00224C78E3|nr:GNAT family N-acyltransferase [Chelatococcus asaccharovorans]CAH1650915.1 L-ornithine N(alpha)-acyltransferase [Chelatococcus asaccharovorans]CAH1686696.1 L-ornithine N(alpha)-acyltransferase [Chelatococcus asaccharovorans]